MPETPVEQLTYPCLEDPMQRHWIQDLAEDADRALVRVRSDIDYVTKRPKAQIRRPTGTTQSIPDNSTATLTFTTIDFDNPNPAWANAAAGTLAPHIPGMYYVDLSTRMAASSPGFPDRFILDVQYNGITYLSRSWSGSLGTAPAKLAGLIPIATHSPLPTLIARMTVANAGANTLFERSRLALQFLARCSPPLNANPYFEYNTVAPWTGQAGAVVALDNTIAYRGHSSMQVSGPTGGAAWAEAVPAVVGKRYIGQMWSRSKTGSNVNWTPQLRWLDAGMALLSTNNGTFVSSPPGSFALSEVSAIAPASTAFVQLAGFHSGVSATFNIAIDDAVLSAACSG